MKTTCSSNHCDLISTRDYLGLLLNGVSWRNGSIILLPEIWQLLSLLLWWYYYDRQPRTTRNKHIKFFDYWSRRKHIGYEVAVWWDPIQLSQVMIFLPIISQIMMLSLESNFVHGIKFNESYWNFSKLQSNKSNLDLRSFQSNESN